MSFFTGLFGGDPDRRGSFNYRTILKLGTDNLQAAVVEYNQEEKNILAYARIKQETGGVENGAIVNIPGVVRKCKEALSLTEVQTPFRPGKTIIGISGEFLQGVSVTLEHERDNPGERITAAEMEQIQQIAKEQAYQQALAVVKQKKDGEDLLLEEVNHSLVEVFLDGYQINNPLHFQGAELKITLFFIFAPLVQLGAVRAVAQEMGLELEAVVAEPFALSSLIRRNEKGRSGGVIIDIGAGTTGLVLIKNGGIAATRMVNAGGQNITRALRNHYDLTWEEAEEMKLAYSRGESCRRPGIEELIKIEINIFCRIVCRELNELLQQETLPAKVYYCGGGSKLKGLLAGIKGSWTGEGIHSVNKLELLDLAEQDLRMIADFTGQIEGNEGVTIRALSYFSTLINSERGLVYLVGKKFQGRIRSLGSFVQDRQWYEGLRRKIE